MTTIVRLTHLIYLHLIGSKKFKSYFLFQLSKVGQKSFKIYTEWTFVKLFKKTNITINNQTKIYSEIGHRPLFVIWKSLCYTNLKYIFFICCLLNTPLLIKIG